MATTSSESAIEEDAADLVFPPEFEKADTKTLLISEVHILLEHRKQVNTYFSLFLIGTKEVFILDRHVCRMEYNYSPLCFPAKRVCRGRARIHRGFHENIELYSKVR